MNKKKSKFLFIINVVLSVLLLAVIILYVKNMIASKQLVWPLGIILLLGVVFNFYFYNHIEKNKIVK